MPKSLSFRSWCSHHDLKLNDFGVFPPPVILYNNPMADTRIAFQYDIADVTSAQRMRFIHSMQFKLILLFWVVSTLLMSLSILFPQALPLFVDINWALVGQISLIYFGTLVAILVVVPWFSFHLNRFWKLPLVFQFNPRNLRLSVAGKPGGLRLTWDRIKRVEGNPRVFLIYYDDGMKHFILPRSAFKPQQEKRFQEMLARYAPADKGEEKAAPPARQQPPIEEADDAAGFEVTDALETEPEEGKK
jgi:hypothetical protein